MTYSDPINNESSGSDINKKERERKGEKRLKRGKEHVIISDNGRAILWIVLWSYPGLYLYLVSVG